MEYLLLKVEGNEEEEDEARAETVPEGEGEEDGKGLEEADGEGEEEDTGEALEVVKPDGDEEVVELGDELAATARWKSGPDLAALDNISSRLQAALATAARLKAEVSGSPLVFPASVASDTQLVRAETALHESRLNSMRDTVAGLEETLALILRELKLTESLVAQGAASDVEVLRLKRQVSDLRTKISDTKSQYLVRAREELAKSPEAAAIFLKDGAILTNPDLARTLEATVGAVDTITRSLAKELGSRKIRVNAINPGLVETEGTHTASLAGDEAEFRKHYETTSPSGRIGQPQDIAAAAVFLASSDSSWVTGEMLYVSGGIR